MRTMCSFSPNPVIRYLLPDESAGKRRTGTMPGIELSNDSTGVCLSDLHQTRPVAAELITIFQTLPPTTQTNFLAIAGSLAAAKHNR